MRAEGCDDARDRSLAEFSNGAQAKRAEARADKAVDASTGQENGAAPSAQDESEEGASSTANGTGGGRVSVVPTRFDYVPGDSVMFMDDFQQDELGEFPNR